MKITMIATSGFYPIHIGGPASVGYFLAKEFGISGHCTTVIVRVKNNDELSLIKRTPELTELTNVTVMPILIDYNLKSIINIPLLAIKIIQFANLFIKCKSDVVLYNSPPVDVALLVPSISRLLSIKQYMILHGGLFNENRNYIGRVLIWLQRNRFDKIVAISSYSKDIAKKVGFKEKKIIIINNGVDLIKYENLLKISVSGIPSILYIGRLEKIKGVGILIKAFKKVHDNLPDAHLYIIGDGSEIDNYKKLSEKLGIANYVHFEGYIPPSEKLYKYYLSCNILVLPSYIENFPITLLEAMFFKIPIIATNIKGGVTELIINGFNGLLVEPGNEIELSKAIIELHLNKKRQENFVEYNYFLIKRKYTWALISKEYIELFKSK